MKEHEELIARKYNIMDKVEKLERELLEIDGVTEVEFDLKGFVDNLKEVIFLTKYDIPVTLSNYYTVRNELKKNVLKVAANNGLTRTDDMIEDYGEWLYFVMRHDDTWNCV